MFPLHQYYMMNKYKKQSSIGMTEYYTHLIPDQIDERKVDFLEKADVIYKINNIKYKPNSVAPNILQPLG